MSPYKNLGGDSGIAAYKIGHEAVSVRFKDGLVYLYTYQSAGRDNIEHMKTLAVAGRGLNTFISTTVKKLYASKSM